MAASGRGWMQSPNGRTGLSVVIGGNLGNMVADVDNVQLRLQFSQLNRRQSCLVGAGLGHGSETWGEQGEGGWDWRSPGFHLQPLWAYLVKCSHA